MSRNLDPVGLLNPSHRCGAHDLDSSGLQPFAEYVCSEKRGICDRYRHRAMILRLRIQGKGPIDGDAVDPEIPLHAKRGLRAGYTRSRVIDDLWIVQRGLDSYRGAC